MNSQDHTQTSIGEDRSFIPMSTLSIFVERVNAVNRLHASGCNVIETVVEAIDGAFDRLKVVRLK